MIFSDTSQRSGLIQECEDICGLGATGITGNASLFQQFTRWINNWNKIGAAYVIQAFDGHDYDDPNYTTGPSGYFSAATTRDYNFDGAYKMLKIKLVNVSYDGANFVPASPMDDADRRDVALNDPNVDQRFSTSHPKYDLTAAGFKLYPAFTSAQVSNANSLQPNGSGGNKAIYVEWLRTPRDYATSGTDTYESSFDLPFQKLPAVGASYEYAKLYKPELAVSLRLDLYGNGGNIKGLLKEMEDWHSAKSPANNQLKAKRTFSR